MDIIPLRGVKTGGVDYAKVGDWAECETKIVVLDELYRGGGAKKETRVKVNNFFMF